MRRLDPEVESNPMVVATKVGILVSDGLRDQSLNLYSAFFLNQEALRLQRRARKEPAWGWTLSISGLLALYMQRLMALATGQDRVSVAVAGWLEADASTLADTREHYLAGPIRADPSGRPSRQLLERMSEVRAAYDSLSDDDGPYHTEVFPYFEFEPEAVLLSDAGLAPFEAPELTPGAEELLIELSTGRWA